MLLHHPGDADRDHNTNMFTHLSVIPSSHHHN